MMRSVLTIIAALTLCTGYAWAADEAPQKTPKDKLSYTLGVNTGKNIKEQGIDVDPDMFARGLKDAMTGAKMTMTEEEMVQVMMAFQKDALEKQAAQMKVLADKNMKEGEAFLAENKKKAGVKTLPSGLQYKVIKSGKGKTPKVSDTVTAHYRGTLINGTEFDSSYKRGEPARFPVKGVIPGWAEALKMMKVGSHWQIFIPANLAYGTHGAPPVIEPNATLIFEIELLAVK